MEFEQNNFEAQRRPRTLTVLGLLSVAALVFSYLGAYALAGTLATAGLIAPWTTEDDPRPRNMVIGFITLMVLFVALGGALRAISSHQLRRIDAMTEEVS